MMMPLCLRNLRLIIVHDSSWSSRCLDNEPIRSMFCNPARLFLKFTKDAYSDLGEAAGSKTHIARG